MRVECREVEFASDKKQHRSHGCEARVATSLALGGLKQAVDGFDKAVGLSGLGPRNDAVKVSANQSCDLLHRFDFRTHDVGAPLPQQFGDDMNLLAFENLAQLLAIQPGAGRSLGGVLPQKRLEVRQLRKVQLAGGLKQSP